MTLIGSAEYIFVESSPFLRCLQTAAMICREIGATRIIVNYQLVEYMKAAYFPYGSPLGKLLCETIPSVHFSQHFLQGI